MLRSVLSRHLLTAFKEHGWWEGKCRLVAAELWLTEVAEVAAAYANRLDEEHRNQQSQQKDYHMEEQLDAAKKVADLLAYAAALARSMLDVER